MINIDDYPYFTHSVKEIYFKFVDQTAAACKAKCVDEFHCTRLIYWELNQYVSSLSRSLFPLLLSSLPSTRVLNVQDSSIEILIHRLPSPLPFSLILPPLPLFITSCCSSLSSYTNTRNGIDLNKYTFPNGTADATVHKAVMDLASKLFSDVRSRITKNVLLKCYNFFLIPMYVSLPSYSLSLSLSLLSSHLSTSSRETVV